MRLAACVTLLVAVPGIVGAEEQAPAPDPIVQVGLYGYRADGSVGAAAFDTQPSLSSTVYVGGTLCQIGAGSQEPPASATDAWRFSGKVLNINAEEAVVQLEWRRVIADGQRIDGSNETSVHLTLRSGDRVLLDQVAMGPGSACQTTTVAFEARYGPRSFGMGTGAAAGRSFGRAVGAGGRTSTGSSGEVRVGSGTGTGAGEGAGGGTGGGVGQAGAALFDVNLWLVHNVPGQPEEVSHQLLQAGHDGASFSFPPVSIATGQGAAIVHVTGSIEMTRAAGSDGQLVFSTARRVIPTSRGRSTRDAVTLGTTRVTHRMPGPEEVLSFEMPPVKLSGQEAPDQFSVRVKITPRSNRNVP
jgi:hypothetical protein